MEQNNVNPIVKTENFNEFMKLFQTGKNLRHQSFDQNPVFKEDSICMKGNPLDPTFCIVHKSGRVIKEIYPAFFGIEEVVRKFGASDWN